jgi:hypothetical protein
MGGKILISTAYLPPVAYFSIIRNAEELAIEKEENYHKQTYRNRCIILASGGRQTLSVPVYLGSLHKTAIKDIRIDYSKRWQQVHLRAINAAYRSSPFFEFYFEELEKIILGNHVYLLDLNTKLTEAIMKIAGIVIPIRYTSSFTPVVDDSFDQRYSVTPKKKPGIILRPYTQVFNPYSGFVADLSIIDLIFNMGPDSAQYLQPVSA